jgi:hypothetical protein
MSKPNQQRDLHFSDDFIEAYLVENVRDFVVEDGIVINLDPTPMTVGGRVASVVPPWKSTRLHEAKIASANRIAVIRVRNATNLGGLSLQNNWEWFGNRLEKFPRTSPLYISRYDRVGTVSLNPLSFTNQQKTAAGRAEYDIRLNLWWAPTGTDCSMHNEHPFLEIHTQIHGCGRIQKFHDRDETTLYEEITMAPGYTHDPFVHLNEAGVPEYPWHRYFSDSDCVWLAIEFHPLGETALV